MSRKSLKINSVWAFIKSAPQFLATLAPAEFVIVLILVAIAVLNIDPWARLVGTHLFGEPNAFVQILLQVPLLGWIIDKAGKLVTVIIAMAPWMLVQWAETQPTLLFNSRKSLLKAINNAKQHAKSIDVPEDEYPHLQQLVREYNSLPQRNLSSIRVRSYVAYALDAFVISIYYPPFFEGWGILRYGIPLATDVNWPNVVKLVVILVLFQMLAKMLLDLRNSRELYGLYTNQETVS